MNFADLRHRRRRRNDVVVAACRSRAAAFGLAWLGADPVHAVLATASAGCRWQVFTADDAAAGLATAACSTRSSAA